MLKVYAQLLRKCISCKLQDEDMCTLQKEENYGSSQFKEVMVLSTGMLGNVFSIWYCCLVVLVLMMINTDIN